jgi:hypothetical protein
VLLEFVEADRSDVRLTVIERDLGTGQEPDRAAVCLRRQSTYVDSVTRAAT